MTLPSCGWGLLLRNEVHDLELNRCSHAQPRGQQQDTSPCSAPGAEHEREYTGDHRGRGAEAEQRPWEYAERSAQVGAHTDHIADSGDQRVCVERHKYEPDGPA